MNRRSFLGVLLAVPAVPFLPAPRVRSFPPPAVSGIPYAPAVCSADVERIWRAAALPGKTRINTEAVLRAWSDHLGIEYDDVFVDR